MGAVPVEVPEEVVAAAARAMFLAETPPTSGQPNPAAEWDGGLLPAAVKIWTARALIAARVRAERDAHWRQRLADLQAEIAKILEAHERRIARVRAEERQRCIDVLHQEALRVADVPPDPIRTEAYWAGRVEGVLAAKSLVAKTLAAGSAVPAATPQPVEVASLPLDELPDWTELAEAVGATLHNSEIGCSGEYETTMRWPDGRTAGNRDRLAIISADSELPSIAEQTAAYRQVEAEYAAGRRNAAPVATPTEPGEPRSYPDGGTCHHECTASATGCWRVGFCGPLSGVYPDNEWPAGVRAAEQDGQR